MSYMRPREGQSVTDGNKKIGQVTRLEEKIQEWQSATGLSLSGEDGDSDGVTPEHLEKHLSRLVEENRRLKEFRQKYDYLVEPVYAHHKMQTSSVEKKED